MSPPFVTTPFPQELIDKTIDELASTNHLGALQDESRDALISCSLVSHSFRPRTVRHLFRRFNPANIGPLDEPDGWERFATLLSNSPHIVRSVSVIVLQSVGGPLDSASRAHAVHIMSLLVHVKRVEVWGSALDHWRPTVSGIFVNKTITQVLYSVVPFYTFTNFISCAATCLPKAENLEMTKLDVDMGIQKLALTSEFQGDTTNLCLPALKTLSCSLSNMSRFFDGVADGTIEMPHLESLKLSYVSMYAACFAPLLKKSPLTALDMAEVSFHDSPPRQRLAPLSLPRLEVLHISFTTYFRWLCDSIPLGMVHLHTVTVRFSRPCQGTSLFKRFDTLATQYLPAFETLRLEDYDAKSRRTIMRDCPGLVERGVLQWGAEREGTGKGKRRKRF